MKRLLIACCALLSAHSFSQTDFSYGLEIADTKQLPKSNLPVVFVERNTFERIEKKTDASGKLSMHFDHGDEWSVSIGEMKNYSIVKTHGIGRGSEFVTYDLIKYERQNRLLPDRRNFTFEKIKQNNASNLQPTAESSVIKIVLENKQKTRFPNIPVALTCFATNKQYLASTNTSGEAVFLVPNKNDYEIDVEEINSIRYADLDHQSRIKTMTLLFEKRQFTEKTTNGYIEQTISASTPASNSHAKVQLTILKAGSPCKNEPVYLRMVKSSAMYKGKTDGNGLVVFMLPVKNKYLVDFTFQNDAGVIDLSRAEGIANQSATFEYKPDPRLEHIESVIPRVKDLVAYDIETFLKSQYPDPADEVEIFMKWGNKFNATSKEAVLEVGFKVNARRPASEIPKNLVFVVDISGSMAGEDRLELVKKNITAFISKCNPTDRIALVVFDDQATLAIPSQLLSNKSMFADVVSALGPRGGTNIYNGMLLGLQELVKYKSPNNVSRLILLTDGYCSVAPETTISKAKEYTSKGIQISTIGVGTSYNQALLSQLATVGGGSLQMAGNPEQINTAFQKELNSIVTPVGRNVKLEILYNDRIVYRQLIGYSNEIVSAGKTEVKFDYLFPGLEKMALVKFDIINSSQEIEKMPVTARLTYEDGTTKKQKVVEKKLAPEWTPATGQMDITIDREHKKVLAIAIANQSLKNMANAFESGNNSAAEKQLESGIQQIKTLFPDAAPHDLIALMKQLEEYVSVFKQRRLATSR